jgi:tetratricopeptide (TPR) repeat protein
MKRTRLTSVLASMTLSMLAGCASNAVATFRYDRPAQYDIEASVRLVGIAEFGGKTPEEKRWGDVASDRLAAQLDAYNKKFQRYQLVDRKRLKAILDEQDLQSAFSDSSQAVQAGKVAHVDAMIFGTVSITTKDERATRMVFDPLSRSTKPMPYVKRYVRAAVNFTFDNVQTSKTIASVSTLREYDSEKNKPGEGGMGGVLGTVTGMGGDKLPAAEEVLAKLVDQCVEEFVAKISPHQVTVSEALRKGKSQAVSTGNTLAAAGEYKDALEAYEAEIKQVPDDHEAMFNAGVCCEALGKLDQARTYYDKAFKLQPDPQYVQARKRVRLQAGGE